MLMASSELIDIKFKNNKQNLALTQSLKFCKPKRICIWASEKIFINANRVGALKMLTVQMLSFFCWINVKTWHNSYAILSHKIIFSTTKNVFRNFFNLLGNSSLRWASFFLQSSRDFRAIERMISVYCEHQDQQYLATLVEPRSL